MKFANKYRIESTRLSHYDYSNDGAYFITICTKDRINYFGIFKDNKVELNKYGIIIEECWLNLKNHYPNLKLDEYIVMPNHFHGIIFIENDNSVETGLRPVSEMPKIKDNQQLNQPETGLRPVSTKIHGLSEFIRAFKSFSSRKINELRGFSKPSIWQERFYERVIRNEKELLNCRTYIQNNPINWEQDKYFN